MSEIIFDKYKGPIWSDTGKPVASTVKYSCRHKLGIEAAPDADKATTEDNKVHHYAKQLSFKQIAMGMKVNHVELYIRLKNLPVTTDERYNTDEVAKIFNIPPGTLAGKCTCVWSKE